MLTVMILLPAVITFAVMLATYIPQSKYKQGLLFAIALPAHAMEHEEIRRIQTRFKKQMTQVSVGMALLLIPFILLQKWFAFQMIYFFAWLTVFCIVMVLPFRRAFRDTLALKRANDWYVGKKRVIQGDLRVAYLKNGRVAPLPLFAIPAAMSAGLMGWASRHELLGAGIGALAITALFAVLSLSVRRMKTKVYSDNSDVNVSLNQASRRVWSYTYLFLAIVENLHYWIFCLLLNNENVEMNGVWLAMTLVFTLIPLGMILYAYRKIKALEQEVLELDGRTVYTDDDEYWANGFTYHNPHDRHVFVEKRVGVGLAVNTGTLTGKILMGGSLALFAAVVLGVSFLLIRSELTTPTLTITPDQRIEIDYPMYSYDFPVAEIEQLELVDEVPSGMKTNGEATDQYARGHFRLKELGKSRLYIFKNNPPYIKIKLAGTYIFFNEQDPDQTKRLFEQLQQQMSRLVEEKEG